MKKHIVLCADDYGQAPPVSHGILKLVQMGRLSAVSCMVNTAYWQEHALWLAPFAQQIDIGLHVNLTEGKPLSFEYGKVHGKEMMSLPQLLGNAFLNKLDKSAITAEFHAQIDRFQQATGKLPDYIDGHHHVHQFPIVRDALLCVYEQRLRPHQAYVRLVNAAFSWDDVFHNPKKIIILATGTMKLQRLLNKNKIPYNQSFAGIYDFTKASHYPQLFISFIKNSSDHGLIMCHPGLDQGLRNTVEKARYAEFQYFSGPEFLLACRSHEVEICRFADKLRLLLRQ